MHHEPLSKAVYTTSEAARLCNLSRRAICRYVAAGKLEAFRVPGSRARRIPRESLLKFMRERGLGTAALETASQLPPADVAASPSDLLLRALEQEGRFAIGPDGSSETGNLHNEQRSDLIVELNPAQPGAQVQYRPRR